MPPTPSIWLHSCFENERISKGEVLSQSLVQPSSSKQCLWDFPSPKGSPREAEITENLEVSCLMFKLFYPLFSNLQGIHHTCIQHHNVTLVNYICSASTANRISDLQFTKLCLPPSGFALRLIQGLLLNTCFVMKMKKKKRKSPLLLFPLLHHKC